MKKEKVIEPVHPILSLIESIDKRYIENIPKDAPEDPQEFLDWWWENYGNNCQSCVLASTRNSIVKPDGLASAEIMIVGEGPGFLEDLTGVPLVGSMELRSSKCGYCSLVNKCFSHKIIKKLGNRMGANKRVICAEEHKSEPQLPLSKFYLKSSGSVIDGILINKYGFTKPRHNWLVEAHKNFPNKGFDSVVSPWFFTNAVLCRVSDSSGIKDKTPEGLPVRICKRWLTFQWAAVQPKIIVCFGRVALETILGGKAKEVEPNEIVNSKFGPVIFQYHPSFFMRDDQKSKGLGYAKIAQTLEIALEFKGEK